METYTGSSGREYLVIDKITSTSFSRIFRAISLDEEGSPKRVIKKFKGEARVGRESFEEEKRFLEELNGGNNGEGYRGVIDFYDFDKRELFLVLGYQERGDLNLLIQKRGRGNFKAIETARVLESLAGTLADIWENQGIVHRDIKPENILLPTKNNGTSLEDLAQGGLVLCDFALALRYNPQTGKYDSRVHDKTMKAHFMGTPEYVAPEIVFDSCRGNEASDVWSLGVVAYEMLTGGLIPKIESMQDLMERLSTYKFPRKIKRNLGDFKELMYWMVQRNPEKRLTARQIQFLCQEFLHGLEEGTIKNPDSKSFFR